MSANMALRISEGIRGILHDLRRQQNFGISVCGDQVGLSALCWGELTSVSILRLGLLILSVWSRRGCFVCVERRLLRAEARRN